MSVTDVRERPARTKPDPIDAHVGNRLSIRRKLLGLSQQKLAEALGITFQQVQKYEKASNRISASRLYRLADVLGVPVSFFFDDMDVSQTRDQPWASRSAVDSGMDPRFASRRDTLELIRAYYAIEDDKLRKEIVSLMRRIADSMQSESDAAPEGESSTP